MSSTLLWTARLCTLLLLGLCAVAAAPAESYTITESVVLPSEYYVGDRAELRVRVQTAAGVELSLPAALPESAWAEFHGIRLFPIDAQRSEIRLSFTAFRPGTQTLPAFNLGGITLRGLTVHVSSVLEDGRTEPAPAEPPMLLPTTRLRMALFAAVLLVGPLLLWVLFRVGRVQVALLIAGYRNAQPYRKLRRTLRGLESELAQLDARSFYIVLLEDLRRYFSRRLRRDLVSATSFEIMHHLSELDARGTDQLAEVFRTGDLVKFAGRPSTVEQRQIHLQTVLAVINQIEAAPSRHEAPDRKRGARYVGV